MKATYLMWSFAINKFNTYTPSFQKMISTEKQVKHKDVESEAIRARGQSESETSLKAEDVEQRLK